MEKDEAVRSLLALMRETLQNEMGLPQPCVNSRVVELSQGIALIDPRVMILPDVELRA